MRYSGGKHRQSKVIAAAVLEQWDGKAPYYEPFCGMISVPVRLARERPQARYRMSDMSGAIITMWMRALSGTWNPPTSCTEKQYAALRTKQDPADPRTAFIGTAMSFGGRWFGTYARDRAHKPPQDFCGSGARSLIKIRDGLQGVDITFQQADYRTVRPRGAIVYLDPPYVDGMHDHHTFRDEEFWDYADGLVAARNLVFITQFDKAPKGWRMLHNWGNTNTWDMTILKHQARDRGEVRTLTGKEEKLFVRGSVPVVATAKRR